MLHDLLTCLEAMQVQTSKAARQEADQLKTQLTEINSNLKSTVEQLDKERTAGESSGVLQLSQQQSLYCKDVSIHDAKEVLWHVCS